MTGLRSYQDIPDDDCLPRETVRYCSRCHEPFRWVDDELVCGCEEDEDEERPC